MSPNAKSLFDSIVKCQIASNVINQCASCPIDCCVKQKCCLICNENTKYDRLRNQNCACSSIVNSQFKFDYNQVWQCPEPWVGDLDNAPVLFLSSNPNIDREEVYPTLDSATSSWNTTSITGMDWSNQNDIEDFFVNRFSAKVPNTVSSSSALVGKSYVDNLRPLLITGKYSQKKPSYWNRISKYLNAILKGLKITGLSQDGSQQELSQYAVLSEIVHCKSPNEFGVKYALDDCSSNYLNALLSIFVNNGKSKMIVVVGGKAENEFRSWAKKTVGVTINVVTPIISVGSYSIGNGKKDIDVNELNINGRTIHVIFVPHPNAHVKKGFKLYGQTII